MARQSPEPPSSRALADPGNVNEILETEIRQIQVLGYQAFVEALVRLKGRRRGKEVDGTFRNLRLFERRDGVWRLVMWYNKALPDWEALARVLWLARSASIETQVACTLAPTDAPEPPPHVNGHPRSGLTTHAL